jgi:hypothetical protein
LNGPASIITDRAPGGERVRRIVGGLQYSGKRLALGRGERARQLYGVEALGVAGRASAVGAMITSNALLDTMTPPQSNIQPYG